MRKKNPKAELNVLLDEINGKVAGLIFRKKVFNKDIPEARYVGKQEMYRKKKRNYKRYPAVGAEKANMTAFGEATKRMKEILKTPESEEYKMWREKWMEQLKNPEIDKNGEKVCYHRFDRFLVAKLKSSL